MKLQVQWVDMRGGYMSRISWRTDVIDEETGKTVGFLENRRSPAERHISLFDGKYQGDFDDHKQCAAFAKGVEAVLNHMVAVSEEKIESEAA